MQVPYSKEKGGQDDHAKVLKKALGKARKDTKWVNYVPSMKD
jgi:hypothetical protein